jgi:hypothetical protein
MGKGELAEVPGSIERRLVADLHAAMKKRPAAEGKLAGALRVLAPHSLALRDALAAALEGLVKRSAFDRETYAAGLRALADAGDKRAPALLVAALGSEQAGGLPALSSACFTRAPALALPLARAAVNRHAHVAFAAEVARAARGESSGDHLRALAPMIKESHRIALCLDLFVPLTRAGVLPVTAAPALAVLRDAERHLGRWLVFADVATRAGDPSSLAEARERASAGPQSSRAAWSLVAWAIDPSKPAPDTRPTTELVARLSERPSADRDMAFLFRLATTRAASARPMLEALAKALPLASEVAVRAGRALARDYGRDDLRAALAQAATDDPREELRALAAASLWDAGDAEGALRCSEPLLASKAPGALAWAVLVRLAAAKRDGEPVVDELRLRRIHWGWLE